MQCLWYALATTAKEGTHPCCLLWSLLLVAVGLSPWTIQDDWQARLVLWVSCCSTGCCLAGLATATLDISMSCPRLTVT